MEEKMSKGDLRRSQIMETLRDQGSINIAEIIERFDCSEATARRDLGILAETEPIIRTIGGAYFEDRSRHEASFREKQDVLRQEKKRIAAKAAELVNEGDVVGLNGGTTTYLIAKELKDRKNITVVTNAVNIAMELSDSDIQVVLAGGVMRNRSFELCGPLAESIISRLHIGKMFLGVDGVTVEEGFTTYSESEAQIDRLMIDRSKQVYAVFDHSKTDTPSLFTIARLNEVHGCVTDRKLAEELESFLLEHSVAVHYAAETGLI